jgi:hypothetical protein
MSLPKYKIATGSAERIILNNELAIIIHEFVSHTSLKNVGIFRNAAIFSLNVTGAVFKLFGVAILTIFYLFNAKRLVCTYILYIFIPAIGFAPFLKMYSLLSK